MGKTLRVDYKLHKTIRIDKTGTLVLGAVVNCLAKSYNEIARKN